MPYKNRTLRSTNRMAAVNRPKRLFTKNTSICEVVRRSIGADTCPVLEGQGEALAKAKR